jgi:hypothetical protein
MQPPSAAGDPASRRDNHSLPVSFPVRGDSNNSTPGPASALSTRCGHLPCARAVVMLSRNDAAAPPREGRKFPCGGRVRAPPRLRAHAVRWICLSRPGPQPAYPRGRLRRPQDDTDIHITSYHSNADADASTHTLLFMCSPSTQEACM